MEGHIDYEFRTTVVKGLHTKESLLEAAEWISGAKEYYLQQFKDSGNVINISGLSAFDETKCMLWQTAFPSACHRFRCAEYKLFENYRYRRKGQGMYQVIKRDGKIVDFNIGKIADAIKKRLKRRKQSSTTI